MTRIRRTLFVLSTAFFASSTAAEDISTENYSTDNRLLSEVNTRMVLESGLVVHL
jgi:hypothetical protein